LPTTGPTAIGLGSNSSQIYITNTSWYRN
jgi:hypothetical protein